LNIGIVAVYPLTFIQEERAMPFLLGISLLLQLFIFFFSATAVFFPHYPLFSPLPLIS